MNRYQIRLLYLGKRFSGSQKQPSKNTVQDEIEKALRTLIKTNICTIFSGRTDAGVSAKSQSAHFDCELELTENRFINSMNGILPEDIRVFELKKVEKTFHAQKSATFRHYQYIIRNDVIQSPFDTNVLFYRHKLDVDRMNKALSVLLGEHDFSAFKSRSDNPFTVCKIYFVAAKKSEDGKYIKIDIIGNRFLYNMVRTIVGTLLLIEKDNLDPLSMKVILNSKERKMSGATAPAVGLTLFYVGYGDVSCYIENIQRKANK